MAKPSIPPCLDPNLALEERCAHGKDALSYALELRTRLRAVILAGFDAPVPPRSIAKDESEVIKDFGKEGSRHAAGPAAPDGREEKARIKHNRVARQGTTSLAASPVDAERTGPAGGCPESGTPNREAIMTPTTVRIDKIRAGFRRAGLQHVLSVSPGSWLAHDDPARRAEACQWLSTRLYGAIHWAGTRGPAEDVAAKEVLEPLIDLLEEHEAEAITARRMAS